MRDYLEKVDGKGAAKNAIRHGTQHVLVDAAPNVHQFANPKLKALPQLQGTSLLAGTEIEPFTDLQMLPSKEP